MMGRKHRTFAPLRDVSLEDLVPTDHFYRHLDRALDLSFVRDLAAPFYAAGGRPSIDPIVFFKLHLIMFFEGLRSERQLMETVHLHLAHRWYIGYDLDEPVPDHSSLSKIRDRYGLATFLRFFERVVDLCIQAGLVWGKELYFDGTKVRANADIDGMVPRFYLAAKRHVQALFAEESPVEVDPAAAPAQDAPGDRAVPAPVASPPESLVSTYSGTRCTTRATPDYERTTDLQVSPTDPAAAPMKSSTAATAVLGYHDHYVVDGGKERIILAALVTPASIMDNTPMLDLARWVRFRWHLHPAIAVGDTRYGTTANIVGMEHDGIRAYLPTPDLSQRSPFYPLERFTYDAQRDLYVCPQGHELRLYSRRQSEEVFVYRADAALCNACPLKAQCTASRSGRHIFRSFFQDDLDQAQQYRETEAYKKAMRKRQVWPEPLFGEAKQWHGLGRFRLRGLEKVNIEGLLIATGQNLKRLLRKRGGGHRPWPTGAPGLTGGTPASSSWRIARVLHVDRLFRLSVTAVTGLPVPVAR
jgi:transposase